MILALGSTRGVGKDTAASFLIQHGYIHLAFADPLKAGAMAIFGLTEAQCNDPVLKETVDPFWQKTPRYILQKVGTECMRDNFGDDIWVRALGRRIQHWGEKRDFVITDLRFLSEAQALKGWGAFLVKITRPGVEPARDADGNIHRSESELLDYKGWDAHIVNAGTTAQLGEKIVAMAAEFRSIDVEPKK
jgi:hypothetical protein